MSLPTLHAVLISWEGKGAAARRIASMIQSSVDSVTVIYSNAAEVEEDGPGTWVRVPNIDFFGRKFQAALSGFSGDVMLLIHADTDCDDWPLLASRCRQAFSEHPDLGLWAPDFTYTPYDTRSVAMLDVPGTPGLVTVAQTDGIITAFARPVVDRLRQLDLTDNNLGWGIDWVAVGYCLCNALLVCRDTTLRVTHNRSKNYNHGNAVTQMVPMLSQLTLAERNAIYLAKSFFNYSARRPGRRSRLWWLWHFVLRRNRRNNPGPEFFGMETDIGRAP